MVLEASIEDYLNGEVIRHGGFTLKLNPQGSKGVPDRLVVLDGWIVFVEVKRPKGGVIAKLQHWWHARILGLGHRARYVYNKEDVDALIREYTEARSQIRHSQA